jgi:large subunit ribosomal protein L24
VSTITKFHVKKDDTVRVISGAHKGKEGKILEILRTKNRVLVQGVHLIKKTQRPTQDNPKGGFREQEGSIHISNVKLISAAEKPAGRAKK